KILFIAHSNGLMKYYIPTQSLSRINKGIKPTVVAYDEVNNIVWAAEGKTLTSFSEDLNPKTTTTSSDSIVNIEPLYNR
ncbi:MAG: hypothetical protein ABEH43_08595, partial [Flavobacteriales bacterium]